MTDLLVLVGDSASARRLGERVPAVAAALGLGVPRGQRNRDGVRVWTWPRRDGSGGTLVEEAEQWLAASGTWFAPETAGTDASPALLSALRRRGVAAVAAQLDGFFAVVTSVCAGPGHVRVVTDTIGSRHVYSRHFGDATAVSTSALLLASLDDTRPAAPDPFGCQELLTTGVIYEERTPWAGVTKLDPGAIHDVGPRGVDRCGTTWDPTQLEPASLSGDAAVSATIDGIRRAIRSASRIPGTLVSDLTAGWDSRLLLAFELDAGLEFETTVTGTRDSADVRIAARIAERLGLRHHPIDLPPPPDLAALTDAVALGDGEVDPVDYARIAAVHRALDGFDVSWNGSFGEVGRGYWWELLSPGPDAVATLDAERIAAARYAAGAVPLDLWPESDRLDPVPWFAAMIARTDAAIDRAPLAFRLDHTYLRMRMRCWQGRIASTTDRLRPCLSPLMFRGVLEPLLRTAPADRVHDKLIRRILATVHPKLAAEPLENGGPAVPITVANAWRFAPFVLRLGRRAARKAFRIATRSGPPPQPAGPCRELWNDPAFEERFARAADWRLAAWCDPRAVERLVAGTRSEAPFAQEATFARAVGLELALDAQARALAT